MQTPNQDTIVAPATGGETAAVAIVRLSGPQALAIFERLFRPRAPRQGPFPERKLVFGSILSPQGEEIDQGLGVVMRAPRSFTGEHAAEFQCHGGRAVVQAVLEACLQAGARLAEPGEFTRRAFFNQRLDLAQAEALADLIAARTQLARKVALRQLSGGLSAKIAALRSQLLDAAAEIEARLDFPEEEIPLLSQERLEEQLRQASSAIDLALAQFERARVVREGARAVLAGSPNAGKSSLFNALVGRERAIVSPHPGTTRDTIESTVDLQGIALTLVDTAGMRASADEIESMGIERARQEIAGADVVLLIADAAQAHASAGGGGSGAAPLAQAAGLLPLQPPPGQRREMPARWILLLNKSDLLPREQAERLVAQLKHEHEHVLAVSSLTRQGLDELERMLSDMLAAAAPLDELELCTARHAACLREALASLQRARQALAEALSGEFVMVDLREAILRLDEILGTRLDQEILDRIFSSFCLGK